MPRNDHKKLRGKFAFYVITLSTITIITYLLLDFIPSGKNLNSAALTNSQLVIATQISNSCKNTEGYKGCYEKELISLSKKSNLTFVKSVLVNLWQLDPRTRSCHSLAHKIASSNINQKSYTLDQVLNNNEMTYCSGGFSHGMIEGYFQTNPSFKLDSNQIASICSKKSTQFSEGSCLHIFGHFILVDTLGDIDKAISVCSGIDSAVINMCYSGIFMENFARNNLIEHGIGQREIWDLSYLNKSVNLCLKYQNQTASGCWMQLGHIAAVVYQDDSKRVFGFCQHAPNGQLAIDCYFNTLGKLSATLPNQEGVNVLCSYYASDQNLQNTCVTRVVSLLQNASPSFYERALGFCQSQEVNLQNTCLDYLRKIFRGK